MDLATGAASTHPRGNASNRLRDSIQRDHSRVDIDVRQPKPLRTHRHVITLGGSGSFERRNRRHRSFTFQCTLDTRSGQVIGSSGLTADHYAAYPGSGQHHPAARQAVRECQQEVERKLYRRNQGAHRLSWTGMEIEQGHHDSEVEVHGRGEFTGGRGKHRYFECKCMYDRRFNPVV
jgi:hypothetical protein